MWFWLATTSGLASALDKVINRISLKDEGKGVVVAYSFVYMSLITLFALLFSFPFNFEITLNLILLLLLNTVVWSLGTLFSFLSQSDTDVSLSIIISRARILWMIPLGYLVLGDIVSKQAVYGMLVIFFGLAVLLFKDKLHKYRGVQLMTLGSLFVALGSTINALLVKNYISPQQVTFFMMLGQSISFLGLLVIKRKTIEKVAYIVTKARLLLPLAAIIETYAIIGLNYAFKFGFAASVTAIYLGMTVLTVWIGVFLLKEKDHLLKKLVSSAIVTAGIIVVKIFS